MRHLLFGRKYPRPNSTGFTIVELLIVIVIIAILATIAIVAFNGVAKNAAQSVLRNDLSQTLRLIQNYRTDNTDFPNSLSLIAKGGAKTADTTYEYTGTSTTFCITASSVRASTSYYVNEGNVIQAGTCPGHFGLNLPTLTPTDMLGVGYYQSCTLAYDETPYCWGTGADGALGSNSTTNRSAPYSVTNSGALANKRVTALTSGKDHSCAIADGAAYCWGDQINCQLGVDACTSFNSGIADALVPTAVSTSGVLAGKTLTKISAGSAHTCALATDGDVYCWGNAQYGKLGGGYGTSGSTTVSLPRNATAGTIIDNMTITDIVAGDDSTCAVADGRAYCWGSDSSGHMGNGTDDSALTAGIYKNTAVAVDTSGVLNGKTVTRIALGSNYGTACVVADGAAYCWGKGTSGQLGNAQIIDSESPVAVDTSGVLNGKTVTDIAVSDYQSVCAIANGAAYCWGYNQLYGALGDGTTTDRSSPIAVSTAGVLSGKTLSTIEGGYYFHCAMSTANQIYCWGRGTDGRLGNSNTNNSTLPVLATDPTP